MDKKIIDIVKQIKKDYGEEIFNNRNRFNSILMDLANSQYKGEIRLLNAVLDDGIYRDISSTPNDFTQIRTRYIMKMKQEFFWNDEQAIFAVDCWGVITGAIKDFEKPFTKEVVAIYEKNLDTKDDNVINIGEYVQMGKYYDEPILWRCVDIDKNGPLMLSDKILTIKPFDAAGNHKYLDGTTQANRKNDCGSNLWETSNMRCWLNSTESAGNVLWLDGCPPTAANVYEGYNAYDSEKGFLSESNFTESERNIIKSVSQRSILNNVDVNKLKTGGFDNHVLNANIATVIQNYYMAYYHNVIDSIFLLDVDQLSNVYKNSYILSSDYYIGQPTQKAVVNSEYRDGSNIAVGKNCRSWLRSPYASSCNPHSVRYVTSDGNVYNSHTSYDYNFGVRPAFYINMASVNFKSGNGMLLNPYILK